MIEISTGVHTDYRDHAVRADSRFAIRWSGSAQRLNLAIAGGGAHPFQHWSEQRIFPKERFFHLHEMYGYLAKQFTVFGQHIHVGVSSGDDAIYLLHMMSRYIPHFIALSASSPFSQGMDTDFDSSRLNNINAFPLSGTMPFVARLERIQWLFRHHARSQGGREHEGFLLGHPAQAGIRHHRDPRLRYAADHRARLRRSAAYAQALARHLMLDRPGAPSLDVYRVYSFNRFTACRYGLEAGFIDAGTRTRRALKEDIAETLARLAPHAAALGSSAALEEIRRCVESGENDASWLRDPN